MRANPALLALTLVALGAGAADKPVEYRGPSEADILAAYRLKIDWINQASRQHMPDVARRLEIRIDSLKTVSCLPLEGFPSHYQCGVLVESSIGGQPPESRRIEILMHKDGEVWKTD